VTVGPIIFCVLLAVWIGYAVHGVLAAVLARKMWRRVVQTYHYERPGEPDEALPAGAPRTV